MKALLLKTFLLFSLFSWLLPESVAQSKITNIDSLKSVAQSGNIDEQQLAFMSLAEHYQKKDSSKSATYGNKVLQDPEVVADSVLLHLMGRKVRWLSHDHKHQEAIDFVSQMIPLGKKYKDTFLLAEIHKRISASFFHLFKYDSTAYHLDKAMAYYKQIDDQENLGLMTLRQGGVNYAMGKYSEAMKLAFSATEIFKAINKDKQLALAYLQLGNIYYFLQDYQQSSNYYDLSSSYYLLIGDSIGWAFAYSNLGLSKIEQDSFKRGLEIQRKALPLIRKSGREISIGNCQHYFALAFLGMEQLDSAEHYIKKSMASNRKTKYVIGLCHDFLVRAKIARKRKQLDSALLFATKALLPLDSIKNFEIEKEISLFLSEVFEEKGNKLKAYEFLKRYNNIRDSLDFDESDIKQMAFDQQAKLERAEYELKLSQQKGLLKEKENQSQQLLIIILSVVAVVSIFFAGLISSTNRKNKFLNKQLQLKQELIENELNTKRALLKEIHHRVKNNLQIISSMLSIQSQYIDDEILHNIIRESRSRIMSMSLIHESLYKREEEESALFSTYVKELIPQLVEAYHIDESKIRLKMEISDLELSLDDSIPCGLIINEVVSNSLKHAFPDGREGTITIQMYKQDDFIVLKIADDGIGFPNGILPKEQDTFGFLLIYSLASQLEAEIEVKNKPGVSYEIKWQSKDDKLLD